jgi:hypothetical protein
MRERPDGSPVPPWLVFDASFVLRAGRLGPATVLDVRVIVDAVREREA